MDPGDNVTQRCMTLPDGDPSHQGHDGDAAGNHQPQRVAEAFEKFQVVINLDGDGDDIGRSPATGTFLHTPDQEAVAVLCILPALYDRAAGRYSMKRSYQFPPR
jgi:hypothetical protein